MTLMVVVSLILEVIPVAGIGRFIDSELGDVVISGFGVVLVALE